MTEKINFSFRVIMEIYYPQNVFNLLDTNKREILLNLFYFQYVMHLVIITFFSLNDCVKVYAFLWIPCI